MSEEYDGRTWDIERLLSPEQRERNKRWAEANKSAAEIERAEASLVHCDRILGEADTWEEDAE